MEDEISSRFQDWHPIEIYAPFIEVSASLDTSISSSGGSLSSLPIQKQQLVESEQVCFQESAQNYQCRLGLALTILDIVIGTIYRLNLGEPERHDNETDAPRRLNRCYHEDTDRPL